MRFCNLHKLVTVLLFVFLLSGCAGKFTSDAADRPGAKPWTNLNFNEPRLQFAVVADRTARARDDVFEDAIARVQLLEPEFVLSVGDLIQGYKKSEQEDREEWSHIKETTNSLSMPFFFLPGNHDFHDELTGKLWHENFGPDYYSFTCKNVLFLILNTAEPVKAAQIEYFSNVLRKQKDVKWTFVLMHQPIWDSDPNQWKPFEQLLGSRNFTVFAGHYHSYSKSVINGHSYYILATTGGASQLMGPALGQMDMVLWVTLKDSGPVIAVISPDGLYDDELK
jgi:hypothetical protein